MVVTLLLGAGVGAGVWLVIRALMPRPAALDDVLDRLARPGHPALHDAQPTPPAGDGWAGPVAVRLLAAVGVDPSRQRQALELARRTTGRHALDKLIAAAAGLAGTALVGVGLASVGVGVPPGVVAVAAVLLAVGGFLLPDLMLRDEAARRRRAFRHALSAYLDLVNVILAGGGGIETALHAAAEAGDGWAFALIRRALHRARLTGRSPWATLAELGQELGVDELRELAASVALAGAHGARIRRSLAAKADTLRGHQVAETEAAAEAATERMTIPVAVLLFGFLLFIAYPAVHQITSVSGAPVP